MVLPRTPIAPFTEQDEPIAATEALDASLLPPG
jgi:hypothetical protein